MPPPKTFTPPPGRGAGGAAALLPPLLQPWRQLAGSRPPALHGGVRQPALMGGCTCHVLCVRRAALQPTRAAIAAGGRRCPGLRRCVALRSPRSMGASCRLPRGAPPAGCTSLATARRVRARPSKLPIIADDNLKRPGAWDSGTWCCTSRAALRARARTSRRPPPAAPTATATARQPPGPPPPCPPPGTAVQLQRGERGAAAWPPATTFL